ncbi:MAG: alkaline shock response membrane anchor protein AmaP [Chloroflexi bacterium]|nr:alkaline shock response membrane anchor protein AmaP [Chloroflexota bacterium]
MNVFNRIIVILLILFLLIGILLFAWNPFWVLDMVQNASQQAYTFLSEFYTTSPYLFRLGQIALAIGAALILGTWLGLEIRRKKPPTVEVTTPEGQKAKILVDSVAMRLAYHLDQLADVINVTPHVRGKGNVVHVTVDVETTPDVDVPMKTAEITHVIREVVEERMGLRLGRVEVHLKHAPYPEEDQVPVIGPAK